MGSIYVSFSFLVTPASAMDDEVQDIRDNFRVGNFEKTIQLVNAASFTTDIAQNEANAIIARAYLSTGQIDKLKHMQNSEYHGQKAAALFAVLTKSRNPDQKM